MIQKEKELTKVYTAFERLLAQIYPGNTHIAVPGEGNAQATTVIIGEAPGEHETLQKRPFVGKAGRNLDEILELINCTRESVYITNIVKFRPFKVHPKTGTYSNRPPTREEIGQCFHVLQEELKIIAPQLVVTLGNVALRSVLDDDKATIGTHHGVLMHNSAKTYKLYPMYHPASIIYNKSLKEVFVEDGLRLGEIISKGF